MDRGQEMFRKAMGNAKGSAFGLGLVAAAGAAAYGIMQSIFTGMITGKKKYKLSITAN